MVESIFWGWDEMFTTSTRLISSTRSSFSALLGRSGLLLLFVGIQSLDQEEHQNTLLDSVPVSDRCRAPVEIQLFLKKKSGFRYS